MSHKKLRICLIGCGRAGMIHAGNYKNKIEGAEMTAVVDAAESAAKSAADELGLTHYYCDYKEMLEKEDIDAVVVVAPTNLHKQIVIDCANKGKHIFCEKPMAMTTIECEEMIAACEKNKVILQIGFMRRFDASFKKAKKMLEDGCIGELVQIHSNTRGPSKPKPWMFDIKKSNGILAEVNSHDIDAVRWMAGSDIESLYAVAGNFRNSEVREEYPDYYDSVLVNGTMKNGVHFCIDGAAYVQYGYDAKMELVGTKGRITVGRSDKEFVSCTAEDGTISRQFVNSWMTLFETAYLEEDRSFVDCIRNNRQPAVSGKDGRMAVATVEAGNLSIRDNKIVFVK